MAAGLIHAHQNGLSGSLNGAKFARAVVAAWPRVVILELIRDCLAQSIGYDNPSAPFLSVVSICRRHGRISCAHFCLRTARKYANADSNRAFSSAVNRVA